MMVSLSFRQVTTPLFPENLLQELCRKQKTLISIPPIWTLLEELPHLLHVHEFRIVSPFSHVYFVTLPHNFLTPDSVTKTTNRSSKHSTVNQ